MKKQFNAWDERMGKRLQQMQGEPAPDAWDRIEAALEEKSRRSWIWMAATLALVVTSLGYLLWQDDFTKPGTLAVQHTSLPAAEDPAPNPPQVQEVTGNDVAAAPLAVDHKRSAAPAVPPVTTLRQEVETGDARNYTLSLREGRKTTGRSAPGRNTRAVAAGNNRQAPAYELPYQELNGPTTEQEAALGKMVPIAPRDRLLNFKVKVPFIASQYLAMEESLEKGESKLKSRAASLWAEAMPTWSYRRVEPSLTDGVVITSMEDQPALAGSRLGGQLATGISMPVGKNLQWKSGAYYWYQQQHWSYSYHNATPDAYTTSISNGRELSVSPVYHEQSNTIALELHNIGLSTGLSYKLPGSMIPGSLETRMQAHYNPHQKLSSLLSFGYSVRASIDKNIDINIGPSVQLQLNNNQNLSPHFQEKPVSVGLQMGVSFKD